ncbi:MAG TPA: hypothetical protein VNY84_08330, partial [Acidimicrobiales bacterium]|nr:hypothetical protein [Acidimicrobiales bacterium]
AKGPRGGGARWRSHAFGLALDAAFPLAGCAENRDLGSRPVVRLELASRDALEAAMGKAGRSVLIEERGPRGRVELRVETHPRKGCLFSSAAGGAFYVPADGQTVRCAPADSAPWRWQRHLVGQVLPFVATLRGLEPFHASAVALGGVAVGIIGSSGQGKSSVAAELVLAGAQFVADDVVALEASGDGLVAHAGTGLITLRNVTIEKMGPAKVARLGTRVGRDAHSVRVAVDRHEQPLPFAACYFLEAPAESGRLHLEQLPTADPRLLLGSSFIGFGSPDRLARQFDVSARLANTVRAVRVFMPASLDFAQVAMRLRADTEGAAGGGPS